MKIRKIAALASCVSALTLGSCGFSATLSNSITQPTDDTSYYKTITYSVGTTGGHFIGPTSVKFKPNRPFYTIQRPEAIKEGFTLSCWTTTQDDITTKVKPTQNISSDLTLYPYFIDSTTLGDVVYTVTTDYLYIWDKTTLCSTDSTVKIKGVRRDSSSQTDVEIDRTSFNYPLSFGTKINSIPNNFLYGCTGFDSEISIPSWITSIGNNFLYSCSSFNKQLIIPSTITTIGTYFLYGCSAFNKDLILNSTLTSIGNYFMVENRAFTSKITVDCPVSVFAGTATESLYSTVATAAIYTTGYEIDGANAQAFWWKYVDTAATNCYRRKKATRFTTVSVTVNSKASTILDDYTFDVYFDDFTSWDSQMYIILTVSRETALLTQGRIDVTAHSITDASGQTFSATQAGQLGRFNFDAESTVLTVNLKDDSGNLMTPRGNLTITVDLDYYTGAHVISGDHNLDVSKSTHKFSIASTNENVVWSISPSDMGTITDTGILTPSAKAIANGGSATITASASSGAWTSDPFAVEFGSFDKLSINQVSGQSYSKVKMLNNTISGSVVIPSRQWISSSNGWSSITALEESAFIGCSSVTSFALPSTITAIPQFAFQNCTGISTIDLSSITSIGLSAFAGDTGITTITIPNTLTSIGNNAFSGCSLLKTINLSSWTSKPNWTGTNIFASIPSEGLVKVQDISNEVDQWRFNYSIKNFLKELGITSWSSTAWQFDNEDEAYLVNVTSGAVTGWASGATTELTDTEKYNMAMDKYNEATIVIPSSATSIADNAFINTTSMTSTIPSALTKLSFETGSALQTIGSKAFYMSTALKSIDFTNTTSLTTINAHAFSGSGITSLTLPASLTTIGEAAFYDTSITSLVIPKFTNTITMGTGAFAENSLLATIDVSAYDALPTWVTDEFLFDGCASSGYIKTTSSLASNMLAWFASHSDVIAEGGWTAGP